MTKKKGRESPRTTKSPPSKQGPITVLCVPDCHVRPNERYDDRAHYLFNFILEARPHTLLFGGDVWELESLCGWNQTIGSRICKNIQADINCGKDFLRRVLDPLQKLKARYNPVKIKLLGNHTSGRIRRVLDEDPSLIGTLGLKDLGIQHWADIIVDYNGRTPGILEYPEGSNILWAHFFTASNFIRPICGSMPARIS